MAVALTGLLAVVALSYQHTGRTDPYELRVDLPDGVSSTQRKDRRDAWQTRS